MRGSVAGATRGGVGHRSVGGGGSSGDRCDGDDDGDDPGRYRGRKEFVFDGHPPTADATGEEAVEASADASGGETIGSIPPMRSDPGCHHTPGCFGQGGSRSPAFIDRGVRGRKRDVTGERKDEDATGGDNVYLSGCATTEHECSPVQPASKAMPRPGTAGRLPRPTASLRKGSPRPSRHPKSDRE